MTEKQAIAFINQQDPRARLVQRRYTATGGEIDLIFEIPGDTILFVEVRSRYSEKTLDPVLSLSPTKIARIKKAAAHFLNLYRGDAVECQFDFVVLDQGRWWRYEDFF